MMPGLSGKVKDGDIDESRIERTKAIILSMTPRERTDPAIINSSRKKRIAAGSGTSVQEINQRFFLVSGEVGGKRRLPF